jgi:tetratricopeptide (TPR) repeat protein
MRALIGGMALLTALAVAAVLFLFPAERPEPAADRAAERVAAAPKSVAAPPAPVATDGPAQLAEAQRLFNTGNTAAARALYVRLRTQFRAQNDLVGEAAAAFGLATLEHQHGQSDAARTAYAEAIRLFEQRGDLANQARVLVSLGDLEKDTFHPREAGQHYRAGMAIWARAPDPKSDTHTLLSVDRTPLMPAGEIRARAVLEQADKIFHNIDDPEGRGDIAMLVGQLSWNLDSIAAAHTGFETARGHYERAGAAAKQIEATLRVATTETLRGYNIAAKEALYVAESMVGADPVGQARVRWRRGDIERLQGALPTARSEYEAALTALAAVQHAETAEVRLKLGQIAAALGDAAAGRREAEAAVQLYRQRRDARGEAEASLTAGRLAAAGDAPAATAHLAAAQAKFREARDPLGEARTALALAEAGARAGTPDAGQNATKAAEQFVKLRLPLGQVLATLTDGDVSRAAGDRDGAANAYRRAANLMTTVSDPIGEAGRVLNLPAVSRLFLEVEGEFPADVGDPVDPAVVRYARVTRAANMAAYPDFLAENKALASATQARLAAGTAFVRGGN